MNNNQVDNRPIGLKMGYESMWSLLDNVSSEDIEKELERFKEVLMKLNTTQSEVNQKLDAIRRKHSVLTETLENRYKAKLRKSFIMSEEHLILVGLIWWGDWPRADFRYSYEELAKKLGWTMPNEYVSDAQAERLKVLCDELPLAVEELTKVTDLRAADPETKEKA